MRRPAGFSLHLLLLSASLFVTVGLRTWARAWYSTEFRSAAQEAATKGALALEARWGALAYTGVLEQGFLERLSLAVDRRSLALSDLQSAQLKERLGDMMRYLSNPTWQEYYRLKTEGLLFEFRPRTAPGPGPKKAPAPLPPAALIGTPKEVTRSLWTRIQQPTGGGAPGGIGGVCVEGFSIATSQVDTTQSMLEGGLGKGMTMLREAINPGFRYPGVDPTNPTTAPRRLYVNMSFHAKEARLGRAGPVYVSLVWLEHDGHWAFDRLLADAWLDLRIMF